MKVEERMKKKKEMNYRGIVREEIVNEKMK